MYAVADQGFRHWKQANSDDRFLTCCPSPRRHSVLLSHGSVGLRGHYDHCLPLQRLAVLGTGARHRATVLNFTGMVMPVLATNKERTNNPGHTVRLF